MANLIGGIISLAVAVIVLANVFIQTVKDTNTTTWTVGEIAYLNRKGDLKSVKKTGTLEWESDLKAEDKTSVRGNAYSLKLEREYNMGKRHGQAFSLKRYAEHNRNHNVVMTMIKNFVFNKNCFGVHLHSSVLQDCFMESPQYSDYSKVGIT